jgi:uncharacterized protein YbcV (DUF1398 family)
MIEIIKEAYQTSKSYPELVKKLTTKGIISYTVDVATSTILYRMDGGEHILHQGETPIRNINPSFSEAATIQAVRDSQSGKIDYPAFMEAIAVAGVRFYEATLSGNKKRVTYIGTGGHYEELIPVAE